MNLNFEADLLYFPYRFFAECDIEYISPADYQPPAESGGGGGGNGSSNGFDDDPYDRLVKGNLKKIEEQKARNSTFFLFHEMWESNLFWQVSKTVCKWEFFFLPSRFLSW